MLRALSAGEMATVYRAFDVQQNTEVALKSLRDVGALKKGPGKEQGDSPERRHKIERFRSEFEIMSQLDHPGVVEEIRSIESG